MPIMGEITSVLARLRTGDRESLDELVPLVHAELRRLASLYLNRSSLGHTWQATDLMNELWTRLLDRDTLAFENRSHFFGAAAHLMRALAIDHVRERRAQKRQPVALPPFAGRSPDEILGIDSALSALAKTNPRQAAIVEMRYFAGLTVEETAEALGLSAKTVKRDWALARVWLFRELS